MAQRQQTPASTGLQLVATGTKSVPSRRRQLANLAILGLPVVGAAYLMEWAHPSWLGDFGSFFLSGWAARTGQDPYHMPLGRLPFTFTWTGAPNLNPPAALPLWALLAALPPTSAMLLWTLGSALLYLGILAALVRFGDRPLGLWTLGWALACGGFWYTLQVGQIYVPLLALVALVVLSLRRDQTLRAGVALGLLCAVKPNLLLWPFLLFLGGQRKTAIVAFLTSLLVDLAAAVAYGPRVYRSWLAVLHAAGESASPLDLSVFSVSSRLGLPYLGLPLAVALLLSAGLWAHRTRPSAESIGLVGLVVALLAAPVAWVGYTILIVPALLARPWPPRFTVSALLLLIPSGAILALGTASAILAMGYPLALGLILVETICGERATSKTRLIRATSASLP